MKPKPPEHIPPFPLMLIKYSGRITKYPFKDPDQNKRKEIIKQIK